MTSSRDPAGPAIRLEGLRAGYGRSEDILRGIDLQVETGETVAILGASGGGKSSLLKVVAGLLPPRAGHVEVLGALHPARPPAGAVGYVPQRLGLVRHGSVLDNVQHGALHLTRWWDSLVHRTAPSIAKQAHEAIESVGLAGLADRPVHTLSGGQQRRAAIARSLIQAPRLLLADEFLGEMDPHTVETVVGAVRRLQHEHGTTALFVEHTLEKAQRFADRVLRLEAGHLQEVA